MRTQSATMTIAAQPSGKSPDAMSNRFFTFCILALLAAFTGATLAVVTTVR